MSEEPAPHPSSPAPVVRRSAARVRVPRGCGWAGLAALVLLAGAALLAWNAEGPAAFPRVAPEDRAGEAFRLSQEAYDVLGFTRDVPPGAGSPGTGPRNTLGAGPCYDGGPLGPADKVVPGTYRMSHGWALDRVPASRAVPALRRLRGHLEAEGWTVGSYREGAATRTWALSVRRGGGEERMSFVWFPDREYFGAHALVPCAYDPAWRQGDPGPSRLDGLTPPALAPRGHGASASSGTGRVPSPASAGLP